MDERESFRWLWAVALTAGCACLVLILAYYLRTGRSFVDDFSPPGRMGAAPGDSATDDAADGSAPSPSDNPASAGD